jgi:hypothetical protein
MERLRENNDACPFQATKSRMHWHLDTLITIHLFSQNIEFILDATKTTTVSAIEQRKKSSMNTKFQLTCLCFGFLAQMTYILPFLFTTEQPSHMTFTDERTFIPREGTSAWDDGAALGKKRRNEYS